MNRFLTLALFSASLGAWSSAKEIRGMELTPDVVYGHKLGMALTLDVIQPKTKPNGRGVLFMVSGGWVSPWSDPEALVEKAVEKKDLFGKILDRGYTLFLVRHGSSPVFKVTEAVEDVRRAVRFVRYRAADFGVDPSKLGVCGGSAGGHLSLMLGTTGDDGRADKDDPVEKTSSRVAAVVAYFPPTDLAGYIKDKRFPAMDFDASLSPSVSPLFHATEDDAPTLLIHGGKDDLVPLKHSEDMAKAFSTAKVRHELISFPEAGHGFKGDEDKKAADSLVSWFDSTLLQSTVLAGTWDASGKVDGADRQSELIIAKTDNGFSGKAISKEDGKEVTLDLVKLEGNKVLLEIILERDGQKGVLRVKAEEKEPGHLVGKWGAFGEDGTEHVSGEWEAKRRQDFAFAGKWKLTAETPEGEAQRLTVVLEEKDGKYSGQVRARGKAQAIDKLEVNGKSLNIDAKLTVEEQDLGLQVRVAAEGEKLAGTWKLLSTQGGPIMEGKAQLERMVDPAARKVIAGATTPEKVLGEWETETLINDQTKDYTLKVEKDADKLKATLISSRSGEHAAKSAVIEKDELVMKWFREVRGTETDVEVRVSIDAEGQLTGRIFAPAMEDYDGTWTAKKKAAN